MWFLLPITLIELFNSSLILHQPSSCKVSIKPTCGLMYLCNRTVVLHLLVKPPSKLHVICSASHYDVAIAVKNVPLTSVEQHCCSLQGCLMYFSVNNIMPQQAKSSIWKTEILFEQTDARLFATTAC